MDPVLPPYKPKWLIRQELLEFIERASKPRKYLKPPRVDRGPRGGPTNERLVTLSTPMPTKRYVHPMRDKYSEMYRAKHPVREGALSYVATSRIIEMAEPRHKFARHPHRPLVRKEALHYVASPRILDLSVPRRITKKWRKKRPVYVKKSALKYKASKQIEKLAKPQQRPEIVCNVPGVKPEALKAFASKRIKELAKPRPLITEVKEHPINPKYRKDSQKKHEDEDDEE